MPLTFQFSKSIISVKGLQTGNFYFVYTAHLCVIFLIQTYIECTVNINGSAGPDEGKSESNG